MQRRTSIKTILGAVSVLGLSKVLGAEILLSDKQQGETIASGPFQPNWDSLQQYQTPDWFRDAKFGIWAHWGPQCQPEYGDWYARSMYIEGDKDYKYHLEKYGHPSKFGFKDVINTWKAERWDPEQLLELYAGAGAKYFVALANHHDNFDNYDSKYQPWNSTRVGPKKDLIGGWAKAAKSRGLKFGVSVHASHAWMFYEKAQKADGSGPFAGIPYDGNIKKESGKNTWWDGLDPQELYAQNHAGSINGDDQQTFYSQWDWSHGASKPGKEYCEKFFNRTVDLINKYEPDLVYFDDTILPLWPVSDAGLRIAAHLYNSNIKRNGGKLQAVLNGKILDEQQRKCMVWDIERGQSNSIEPLPWQTDTCLGDWHYDRPLFERHGYKSAKLIVHTLADIVSKNGNLLLNVPVRGDGTIDKDELEIVEGITTWMKINSESIYNTRPWKIFGEGPAMASAEAIKSQGFNEGTGKSFTAEDIRFTSKGDILYAIALGVPTAGKLLIKTLGANSAYYPGNVGKIVLLGNDQSLHFVRDEQGLLITLPENNTEQYAYSFKIFPA
jgi:alpha-L-fucosidase